MQACVQNLVSECSVVILSCKVRTVISANFMKIRRLSTSKMVPLKKVTHVIFDMDGLLLDTETLYTIATTNIIKGYGKTYSWEVKSQVMGLTQEAASKKVVELYKLPITDQEFSLLAQEQYNLLMPACTLMPGAERIVTHLAKHNIPMAIATSSIQDNIELKIARYRHVFNLFNHIVAGSDPQVQNGKPKPDIFLLCAARFPDNPKPKRCLVLEDAPSGVTAAIAAGMQCIMVPDPQLPKELTTGATLVIRSLNDIDLEAFGLPPLLEYED